MNLGASHYRIRAVVSEIMASPLVTGNASARFGDLSEHDSWGHLDQIPVEEDGRIIGVCDRPMSPNSRLGENMRSISNDMLVSSETPLLSLFDADWIRHPFFLVVEGTRIVGIVTPSDLNKLPVFAAIFDLIATLENRVTNILDKNPTDESRLSIFSPRELGRTKKDYEELREKGFDISRLQVLYLNEKLKLYSCESADSVLTDELIVAVNVLRNSVFHQNPLVNSTDHISEVSGTLNAIDGVLAGLPSGVDL